MLFFSRRVPRFLGFQVQNAAPSRTHNVFLGVASRHLNSTAVGAAPTVAAAGVTPIFIQNPPAWVRFAWPIIIANALLMYASHIHGSV